MKVTVHFIGICTHIKDTPLPLDNAPVEPEPPGTVSRVVLVDARNGLRVCDSPIAPHTALLCIPPGFIAREPESIDGLTRTGPGAWIMGGVQLQLGNSGERLLWTQSYRCLPSLTQAAGPMALALNNRVVEEGDAACVFRIPAGTLEAYTSTDPSHAVIGKLTLETGEAELTVMRIWNRSTSSIALQRDGEHDPEIFVANVGSVDGTDTVDDFMLHYGVTTWAPDRCFLPENTCTIDPATEADTKALEAVTGIIRLNGLAFGCSNSTYP